MNTRFPIKQIAAERGLRLFKDPCYPDAARIEQEDYLEIRGRKDCCLYGNNATTFWVETTSGRAPKYMAIPHNKAVVSPDGGEARFLFPIESLDAVLRTLQPRKKRVLSAEQKKRLAEASAAYRFHGSSVRTDGDLDEIG